MALFHLETWQTPYWLQTCLPDLMWRGPNSYPRHWHKNRDCDASSKNTSCQGVYLTFDDGPDPRTTPEILTILDQTNAKATFFVVGKNVDNHPDLLKQIFDAGHTIGNHTYSHINGWRSSVKEYQREIRETNQAIARITGTAPKMFRPPYGRIGLLQYLAIRKNFKTVMWTVNSRDYDSQFSTHQIFDHISPILRHRSIVLLHDNPEHAPRTMPLLNALLNFSKLSGIRFLAL